MTSQEREPLFNLVMQGGAQGQPNLLQRRLGARLRRVVEADDVHEWW
jgi:hypothetical protein